MSEDATLDDFESQSESGEQKAPNEWVRLPISDISEWTDAGGTPRTSNDAYWGGSIPWVQTGELTKQHVHSTEKQITEVGLEESTAKLFPPRTLLVGMYGEPTLGESALLETEAATNQACCGIYPDSNMVNSEFFHHMMQYEKSRLYSLRAGSGQQNIRQEIIRKFELNIPPLPEQRKIATVLHAVDQAIQKTEKIILKRLNVKRSLMGDLLSGAIRTDGGNITLLPQILPDSESGGQINEDRCMSVTEEATSDEIANIEGTNSDKVGNPEHISGVRWSELESVPEEWQTNNLKSDIKILAGNSFSSEEFVKSGGMPLIRIRDLGEDDTTVSFKAEYDPKYLIDKQDLLVGMDGHFEPHLWGGPQALLNQRVCRIAPGEKYNKIFLRYAIEKPLFYIQKSTAGTTVKHLSQSNINDINLPTPPLHEQRQIATVLYTADQSIQQEKEYKKQLLHLRRGLMQDLLSGTVRTSDTRIQVPDKIAQYG